jgi:Protein of unknown function (DUF4233)
MRMFCASVLFFEAIVVGLAIPVALTLTDADPALVGWAFGALAVACLVCAGLLGRPWGVPLGWVLQVCVLLTGLVVPAMIALGLVFGGLWVAAVRYGRRVDQIKASRAAGTAG